MSARTGVARTMREVRAHVHPLRPAADACRPSSRPAILPRRPGFPWACLHPGSRRRPTPTGGRSSGASSRRTVHLSAAAPRSASPTPLRGGGSPCRGRCVGRTTRSRAYAASPEAGTPGGHAWVWDRVGKSALPTSASESASPSCPGTPRAVSDASSSRATVPQSLPASLLAHHAVTASPIMPESSRSGLP